ncbi:MAG: DNRLRE domain-containing protein [candidate division KSB1 bacterium]|nr:DNRLRE domain-containing protein [candidate division KSB1 bacterium]MDZ7341261.1 DNRLRE domain-containing protein [candidate division KSB1 bacterium]
MQKTKISFQLLSIILMATISLFNLALAQTVTTDSLILQPGPEGKDSYICDCSPNTNSPNGGTTLLYQGQFKACYDRLLIEWDLSALPANATIVKAEMKLYCYNLYGSKAAGKMTYYRITSFWNEDSVTYNSRPDTCHDVTVTANCWPTGGNWHSVDITPFVQGWHDGKFPNYGIYGHCIQTNGTCVAGFHSSDHPTASQRPRLIIIFKTSTAIEPAPPQPQGFNLLKN